MSNDQRQKHEDRRHAGPDGRGIGQRLARASTIFFFGALMTLRFTAAGSLDGGTLGDGAIPGVLTVQFDHRDLTLLGNVGPQAGHFALLGRSSTP
jgi:hypothetical protein